MKENILEYLTHIAIGILLLATLASKRQRKRMRSRKGSDWMIEIASLLNHFFLIPIAQASLVLILLETQFKQYESILNFSFSGSLLLYIVIDYAWYWNHRILHSRTKLWNFHMVHHSAQHLDVLSTPRNTLFSPLLMVYFWLAPIFIYLLADPIWFLIFSSLGLIINFWGHTKFSFKGDHLLGSFLIMPKDHFWHHSTNNSYCNFGTVFNFWDRVHGTWYRHEDFPKKLGFPVKLSTIRQILFPF